MIPTLGATIGGFIGAAAIGTHTVLDSATKSSSVTLSNGGRTATSTASGRRGARSVVSKSSGKFYFEAVVVSRAASTPNEHFIGVATEEIDFASVAAAATMGAGVYLNSTAAAPPLYSNGVSAGVSVSGSELTNGERISFAIDLDNYLFWAKRGTGDWNNNSGANPATAAFGAAIRDLAGLALSPIWVTANSGDSVAFNFGDSAFAGSVPSGFTAGWPSTPDNSNTNTGYSNLVNFLNSNVTLSGSNLVMTHSNTSPAIARSMHQKATGKYYFEVVATDWNNGNDGCGLSDASATAANAGSGGTHVAACYRSGNIWSNGANSTKTLGTVADGDRIGIAIDFDNQKVWFRKNNGNWNGDVSANPATNTGGVSTSSYPAMAPHGTHDSTGSQVTTFKLGPTMTDTTPSGFTTGWPIV